MFAEKKRVGREARATHASRAQANKRHTIATSSFRELWPANDGVGTSGGTKKRGRSAQNGAFGHEELEADEQQPASSRFALRPRSQKRPRYAEVDDDDEEELQEAAGIEQLLESFEKEEVEEESVIGGARAARRATNRIASHDPDESTAPKHSPQVAVEFSDEY